MLVNSKHIYIMKKIGFILFIAASFITTSFKPAEELKWYNFDEGYKLAQKKNKIMLVDLYTDWCGWCKRMDRDTYAKSEVIGVINQDFVAIKFNPEITGISYTFEGKKYNGDELAKVISKNELSGYPTTVFYYPKSKKTNVVGGYFEAARFKGILESVKTEFITAKK
jgi:thioredoxin-related protein